MLPYPELLGRAGSYFPYLTPKRPSFKDNVAIHGIWDTILLLVKDEHKHSAWGYGLGLDGCAVDGVGTMADGG